MSQLLKKNIEKLYEVSQIVSGFNPFSFNGFVSNTLDVTDSHFRPVFWLFCNRKIDRVRRGNFEREMYSIDDFGSPEVTAMLRYRKYFNY